MTYIADTVNGIIKKKSDGTVIDVTDPNNPDYRDFLIWLSLGNQPIVLPSVVTPRQIRIALNQLNLRTTIENAISVSSQDVKDTWLFSNEIERNNPLLLQFQSQLGITESQLDDLFLLASTL